MGACTHCAHFRRARPASQLLSAAIGDATTGAELASAVSKIVEDEQKVRDAESDVKSKEGSADRQLWPMRPTMSDYCGVDEAKEIYRIAEVKNRGLACGDFREGKPERHACADCSHRIAATGKAKDFALESTHTRLIASAVAVQASPQVPQAMLQAQRAGAVARKALELSSAYAAKGHLLTKPAYLDYCGHFSSEDEFVVCVLQNPHNTCAAWAAEKT